MTIANRFAQDEVLKILFTHGITLTEIAEHLGCTVQVLSYQLNSAKHFDSDMEREIYKYFAKKGITQNSKGEVKMVLGGVLEVASMINHQIAFLTQSVTEIVKDDKIDDKERANLLSKIRAIRFESVDQFNHLEALVSGAAKK